MSDELPVLPCELTDDQLFVILRDWATVDWVKWFQIDKVEAYKSFLAVQVLEGEKLRRDNEPYTTLIGDSWASPPAPLAEQLQRTERRLGLETANA